MQTKNEFFSTDYAEKAHLQKGFNPHLIDDLVDYILRIKPDAQEKPIRILDLACGDGGSTYLLLQRLNERGLLIESIVGYDISPAQIDVATTWSKRDSRLQFEVQDINALCVEENFDVVLSLFGLHWIEDICGVACKIQQCLKPDGILMFFVPLEKEDLFALRLQLIQSKKWRDKFSDFSFKPFISEPSKYFQAFSPLVLCENELGIYGEQHIDFERERFAEFLTSWMQELRHLQNPEDKDAFVKELIDSIPESEVPYPDVKPIRNGKIQFVERFFWFHAKNNSACAAVDTAQLVVPGAPGLV